MKESRTERGLCDSNSSLNYTHIHKTFKAPQSDSTPDVLEGGEKDHLCPIKVNMKTISTLIIHQQKHIALGKVKCQRANHV